ncbi:SDR family NAD(P)-dependent oxidoreductase [Litoribrevibacter albus]|uniref:3-oxoacyl-ACP reductase n=1 Tax=Litoribrevibacter albus TaxID=1473156 RepID=A0AA37SC98_9GAMM|nr:SDR family oxidoreductase [Litoribrevibacter albus]GLQ32754.1 3-oxoacyl-ACP reductase [Litoribrevibacter albus]
MSIKNTVVIVTGASSGMGVSIAEHLYQAGYALALHGRDQQRLSAVAAGFDDKSRVITVAGDVAIETDRAKLVAATLEAFGKVDALVNNAGIFSPKPFLEVTEADLDQYLSTNLKGTYFLTQKVIPLLQQQGGGSVINMGTVLVNHALGGVPATAPISSKGGIHGLTVQLAAEFGKDNIRVNTIAPGIIRTPMHARNGIDDSDSLAGLHLLNRIGEGEHIATMVEQLISNDFVSGTIINVDGGHVAGHHLG